jgi:hypothetical protein
MWAMSFEAVRQPLVLREVPKPAPGPSQVLVKVSACGVCRTDLHVVDGELPNPKLPLIPGHEIVGRVEATGEGAGHFHQGDFRETLSPWRRPNRAAIPKPLSVATPGDTAVGRTPGSAKRWISFC